MKKGKSDARAGFILYVVVMLVLTGIYLGLQSTVWGRHVWEILSTQPTNWHL